MSARHDQEGAPQVGFKVKVGCALLSPLNFRVHRPFSTLRRQLPWAVGASATSRTTIFRTGASGALVSPMHHSRVFPRHPTSLTCSFALYARAQTEFVTLCESACTKGGRHVGLDIQVHLLESIHSQSTSDSRAAQERR